LSAALEKFGKSSISNLRMAEKSVVSIAPETSIINALRVLFEKDVSCVALVDPVTKKLVGNFSPSDIHGLYKQFVPHLLQPVKAYLEQFGERSLSPVTVKPTDSIAHTIGVILGLKLHHIWVVNDSDNVVGIVSLTDICAALQQFAIDSEVEKNVRAFHVPGTLEVCIVRAYDLVSPGQAASIRLGDEKPSVTRHLNPANALVWEQNCLFPIRNHDVGKQIFIEVKGPNNTLIGTAEVKLPWILNGYGTGNASTVSLLQVFKLRDSQGNTTGKLELQLYYE